MEIQPKIVEEPEPSGPLSPRRAFLMSALGVALAIIMLPTVVITYYNLTGSFPKGPTSLWLIPLVCYLCTGLAAFVLGQRGIMPAILPTYAKASFVISMVVAGMMTLSSGCARL